MNTIRLAPIKRIFPHRGMTIRCGLIRFRLSADCTEKEVLEAYRRICLEEHPDLRRRRRPVGVREVLRFSLLPKWRDLLLAYARNNERRRMENGRLVAAYGCLHEWAWRN